MPVSIDNLEVTRGLIDLSNDMPSDFGFDDYKLKILFDDIILVEYVDENEDGDAIKRGSLYIPLNTVSRAWRKGRVILTGINCKYVKVGDIVMFPHERGIEITGLEIDGAGKLKKGRFLNEQRLFGICTQ